MEVTEAGDGAQAGKPPAWRAGSVITEPTDTASAWNSFCEVEGREAGVTGVEGVSRFTQQAGVAQCLLSQPVQQQLRFARCAAAPTRPVDAKTPCQARTNPSKSTTAILIGNDVIFSDWSL